MKDAHGHMHLKNEDFDAIVDNLIKSLVHYDIDVVTI
jgi:hypothetical protein